MVNSVFWDVDTQRDFFEPFGKLYVPGVEAIIDNISNLTRLGEKVGRLLGSVDAHGPRDVEFKEWPEHCVYGTPGQRKIDESVASKILYVPSIKLKKKQIFEAVESRYQVIFEKQSINIGSNPNVKPFLELIDPDLIVIYGVVTEICVDQTVHFLTRDLGYETVVALDSIKEIDSYRSSECISKWENLGVGCLKTGVILKYLYK